MSVAERTREAVRERPFLYEALRAGIVNYTAAARLLDCGDVETVAAALRRFADELESNPLDGGGQVRMQRGLGAVARTRATETEATETEAMETESVLEVGETAFYPDVGRLTGVIASGDPTTQHFYRILGCCHTYDIDVVAAGMVDESIRLVVDQADAPHAVRLVEAALES